ncbi:saccharopine dehydrogenase NADP-binding domain-containing protein [Marinobacter daepoensis]|uniref:Saccharopine dehydrogenase NADP-binding domain-containing protein n=1 Tax=Marinobacter daepoensis TaxID=262077 RepID=A0ABS3BDQ5_9GAMM|nr:saccharopine dehydrogenase NADP-binding domain-containing protein [Marinobacter daepoensis]MBN7769026.1 saccharopine dehydrogenase NADP-binding domain-containing protein [Marinobacter daepoensis]MBY6032369.1 saccharopine dehydrogenase NADP-binding domain-containing protein [Marinobacter daepoensis]MBY6077716.1 saccharopine dehydrogenase NADP-binding domain-containing protein [Marinobacter daepoensis]
MTDSNAANYDLVVFGATSFVGQILARYLVDNEAVQGLKWAIAGRSEVKLNQLKSDLGSAAAELPVILADASDEAALTDLCNQTRVVISTVGPYALFGETLVKVCAETGTDYCDLTGEVQWIRRMIERYEESARKSGARIVHCCGFDSIPSDMGVWFLQQQAEATFGKPCQDVRMRVKVAKGGLSGGTVASMINIAKEVGANPKLRKELANPFSICPPEHRSAKRQPSIKSAEFDKYFNAWLAPFVMGAINTRVVHRSNALQGARYGKEFTYDEAIMTGKGAKGRLSAYGMVAALGAFFTASAIKPTRWVVEKLVPQPGEGPSPEDQQNGFYDIRFVGRTDDGKTMITKVTGDRDPGYGSTAKMLGEAGLCLAFDLKDDVAGGFWTPASALNGKLLERLQANAGLTFEVVETR